MSVRRFLTLKIIIGTLVAVAALTVFNLTRSPLETEVQAAFTQWYSGASKYLDEAPNSSTAIRKIFVRVKMRMSDAVGETSEWTVPAQGLENREQRGRLARVLQLIQESGVFGQRSYLKAPLPGSPYISFVVSEDKRTFEANIPIKDAEHNIQIQNLMKLLEVFSSTPPTPNQINPGRL